MASMLQYCVSFETPQQLGSPPPSLGSPIQAQMVVSLYNDQPVNVTAGKIVVRWASRFIYFNITRAELRPGPGPAEGAPGQDGAGLFPLQLGSFPLHRR